MLGGDEPVAEPAVQGGGGDAEFLAASATVTGALLWVVVGRRRGISSGGAVLDTTGGERLSAGAGAALPVEDCGDDRVGVMDGEATNQATVSSSVRSVLFGGA